MNIIVLVDWRVTAETKFWLKDELIKLGNNTGLKGIPDYDPKDDTTNWGKIKLWFKYFKLAISGIRTTRKGDVLVSWNFVVGAIAAFICKLFGIRRKIISLNMIAHEKGFLNTVLRKFIYNIAFRNKNLWISVNDEQLIEIYSRQFKFPVDRIFVLHDIFYDNYEQSDFSVGSDYIFTGGDAYRDWEGLIQCAANLPAIQFVGVARKKNFPSVKNIPANLKMYYDIDPVLFYSLLKGSKIVFLPLNSLAPCGLIVMIKAALLSKPVIITETASTKNYIQNNVTGKLIAIRDVRQMQDSLLSLYTDEQMQRKFAENLKEYLKKNFSTKANAEIINNVINKIE